MAHLLRHPHRRALYRNAGVESRARRPGYLEDNGVPVAPGEASARGAAVLEKRFRGIAAGASRRRAPAARRTRAPRLRIYLGWRLGVDFFLIPAAAMAWLRGRNLSNMRIFSE